MNPFSGLEEALREAGEAFRGSDIPWVLGGSASLLLRGISLDKPPRDLDIYVDARDAPAAHDALKRYAVDLPVFSVTDIYSSTLSHYEVGGVSVEIVGGFVVSARGCSYQTEVREVLLPFAERITFSDVEMALVPLAHELWFNALRARMDRVRVIASVMAMNPEKYDNALNMIESRNSMTAKAVSSVHAWIANGGKGGAGNEF